MKTYKRKLELFDLISYRCYFSDGFSYTCGINRKSSRTLCILWVYLPRIAPVNASSLRIKKDLVKRWKKIGWVFDEN